MSCGCGTYHLAKTPSRDNVSSVDETVQVAGGLLDGLAHIVITVDVEDIGNQVEGVLVVLNLGVQTRQVESISQVLFVDLAEVFVPSG